jgi:phage-related protein
LYDLFEDYGQDLPTRYLKKISKDVWELRPGDVRLFLTIKGNKGFVVHGIRKKSQKTPKKDLDLAAKRAREV